MDAGSRVVTLMPEYGLDDVPLWPRADETDAMVPPELLTRLRHWQVVFEAAFHYENGWSDTQVRDQWAHEAEKLAEGLRQILPSGVVLEVNLWPLGI